MESPLHYLRILTPSLIIGNSRWWLCDFSDHYMYLFHLGPTTKNAQYICIEVTVPASNCFVLATKETESKY